MKVKLSKMIDLNKLQKDIYQNKVNKGFNLTDIPMEFCYIYGELGEAYSAWLLKKGDLGEELADVAIFLLGMCEMLDIDLEKEINHKIDKNARRVYKEIDGIMQKIEM